MKIKHETLGGALLFLSAAVALVLANSDFAAGYFSFINAHLKVANIDLTVSHWAAELLLAVFFFVVGIELKHEIIDGTLSSFKAALIPISAAIGGMAVAASIFVIFNFGKSEISAWATPISTDVAFAIAVLSVFGKRLPNELRSFLLTLAVVNDLLAILVIAFIYGSAINFFWLGIAAALILIFAKLQDANAVVLILVAIITWYATLQSGIHATVAGVALGLAMQVHGKNGETNSIGLRAERKLKPYAALLFAPFFAFTVTGISFTDLEMSNLFTDPLSLGIILGFVVGQPIGVITFAYAATRLTRTKLNANLAWWDIYVVGTLAGIGFTVAFLVAQISLGENLASLELSKLAILSSNLLAILVAISAILIRSHFRQGLK